MSVAQEVWPRQALEDDPWSALGWGMGMTACLGTVLMMASRQWGQWTHAPLMRALHQGHWVRAWVGRWVCGWTWDDCLLAVGVAVARPRAPWTTDTRMRAARWLMAHGADPMGPSVWPGLAMPMSAWHSPLLLNPDWVTLFLAQGARLDNRSPVSGLSVLESWFRWAQGGDLSTSRALAALDFLMAAGLDLNQPFRDPEQLSTLDWRFVSDGHGRPLTMVAFEDNPQRLIALLDRGLAVETPDAYGQTLPLLLRMHVKGADVHQPHDPDGAAHVLAYLSERELAAFLAQTEPAVGVSRRSRL